jgi:hypothetical protein
VELACGGDDECDRAFTHNAFDAPDLLRVPVFNCGLVDERPSLMRVRTSMANMLFSSDCNWFASLMKRTV